MTDLDWASIGVCWALTTITTIALFAAFTAVRYFLRRRKRKTKTELRKLSERNGDIENGQLQPLMELRCPLQSKQKEASTNLSSSGSAASHMTDRRKRDDVSRWCTEHGLPERLVETLRQQGFETKAALDGLRPEDLQGRDGNPALLQLTSKADVVQLRNALTKTHGGNTTTTTTRDSSNRNSSKSNVSGCSSTKRMISHLDSTTSDRTGDLSPTTSSDVFLRGADEIDGHFYSRDDSTRKPRPSLQKKADLANKEHQRFHGLLSDEGLWELTKLLGHEWRQLATLLNISVKTQERLRETHSQNISAAIQDMLVTWRDGCNEGKEQMKGQLHSALLKVERKDIADRLMEEQLHGSYRKKEQRLKSLL